MRARVGLVECGARSGVLRGEERGRSAEIKGSGEVWKSVRSLRDKGVHVGGERERVRDGGSGSVAKV